MLFSPRRRREYTGNKERKKVKDDQHNKIWEYLLEISDILNGGSSDSQIALLLTENLRDIYAYIFPLIHEDNSRENLSSTQLMGSNALAHLKKYLSEEIIVDKPERNHII